MLKKIPSERDENVRKINSLIDEYNASLSTKPRAKLLMMLQKIDALTLLVKDNNLLLMWAMSNPIRRELVSRGDVLIKNETNQKIIMSALKAPPTIPTNLEWQQLTEPSRTHKFNVDIDRQYCDIALMIHQIKEAESLLENPSVALVNALKNLQTALLSMDIPKDNPLFWNLLEQTNTSLNALIERMPEEKAKYRVDPSPIRLSDESWIKTLMSRRHPPDSKDGFVLSLLGGANNINWFASNPETGEKLVVRVEPASGPMGVTTDYLLLEEIKHKPELSLYFAKDLAYYPTGFDDDERCFNIAVSEYCEQGNLESNRAKQGELNDALILSVLNQVRQVAAMASALNKDNKAYTDIKSTNFLMRRDGSVITADTKSVIRTQAGQTSTSELTLTNQFAPPESDSREPVNAEKMMIYQIGLMMYFLLTGIQGFDAQNSVMESFKASGTMHFSPALSTTKTLIEACLSADPERRPSLDTVVESCQTLKEELRIGRDCS